MFADELRRAVEATPRSGLPELAKALWRAYGAEAVSASEAEELAALIEVRKAVPADAPPASRRRVGSRPRTSESMERRRRWAASGRLPPTLAARFTLAEAAVLAVIAVEVSKGGAGGDCRLPIGAIGALAGVCATTVRNAIREARALGLLTVEERRISAWRNAPNVVRIVSAEWRTWLRLARSGGGYRTANPTNTRFSVGRPEMEAATGTLHGSRRRAAEPPERFLKRRAGG